MSLSLASQSLCAGSKHTTSGTVDDVHTRVFTSGGRLQTTTSLSAASQHSAGQTMQHLHHLPRPCCARTPFGPCAQSANMLCGT
jgi:hypothetical protein